MMNLLFSSQGRILPRRFWQGLIVLTVASIILSAMTAYMNPLLMYLGVFLLYPYVCVFGKRLHDAGKSAWFFLAFLVGYIIISLILQMILVPIFGGADIMDIQAEAMERAQSGDLEGALQGAKIIQMRLLPASIINTVLSALIVGGVAAALKSDPNENQYGLPPNVGMDNTFN